MSRRCHATCWIASACRRLAMRLPKLISNRLALATGLVFVLCSRAGTRAAGLLETMDAEVSSLYEKSKDGIVRIHANSTPLYGRPPVTGTGFFIDTEGRLATSAKLVDGAQT